jgi:hypothetical protein
MLLHKNTEENKLLRGRNQQSTTSRLNRSGFSVLRPGCCRDEQILERSQMNFFRRLLEITKF